jgi:hypothetical protein
MGWPVACIQVVVAIPTCWSESRCSFSASAGVRHPSVFLGLALSVLATASRSSALCRLRSVPFGSIDGGVTVFSLLPVSVSALVCRKRETGLVAQWVGRMRGKAKPGTVCDEGRWTFCNDLCPFMTQRGWGVGVIRGECEERCRSAK